MHDPEILAFTIKSPIKRKGHRKTLISIWHVDPCIDGSDDSCGWFMRARHGDQEVLGKIIQRFEFDWDRVFVADSHNTYFSGLFTPDGDPHFSVHGIVLNLFLTAACVVFESDGRTNWKRAKKFLRKHLFDILIFAENPVDSLHDGITRKFEIGCAEKHDQKERDKRIRAMAACIYGWILREEQYWWQHPRWHIHHWKIQWNFVQDFVNRRQPDKIAAQETYGNS